MPGIGRTVGRSSSSSSGSTNAAQLGVGDRVGDGLVAAQEAERGERGVAAVEQPQLHRLVGRGVGHEQRARVLPRGPSPAKASSITHW